MRNAHKSRIGTRMLSIMLSFLLVLTLLPMSALAAGDDITGHWAEAALREWAAEGLFAGDGGGFYRPDASITRAEFFTLINRWKGYTAESDTVGQYTDVSPAEWYYKEVAAALAAGYTGGTGPGLMAPESPVTREQAMIILGRLAGLTAAADTSVLAKAGDGNAVSSWAKGLIAAVLNEGLIAGSDGKINPLANITRAETIVLLKRMRDNVRTYAFAGTYGPASGTKSVGSVTVAAPGVILQNLDVKGDLTVSEAVGAGEATLNNINIEGRLRVLGGGLDSVYLNNCTIRELIVEKDRVRVVLDGGSSITLARLSGTDDVIELQGTTTIGTLTVIGGDTTIRAGAAVTVTTLNAEADGTALVTQAGTKIGTANISGETNITGAGTITTANISSPGVSIETRPGSTNVGSGLTASVGGQTVTGGASAPGTGTPSTGGGGDNPPSSGPVYASHSAADKTVAFGTVFSDLGLPATVTLTANTGATGTADVAWDGNTYNPNTAGAQSITGTLSGATVAWAPATVTVTVTVSEALTVTPVTVADVTVRNGGTEDDAKAKLPAALLLTLSDGSVVQVFVTWELSGGTFDNGAGAENTFTAHISGLPAAVSMTQTVTVKVIAAADNTPKAAAAILTATPGSVQLPAEGETANVTLSAAVSDQFGDVMTTPLDLVYDVEKDTAGEYPAGVSYGLENLVPTVKITSGAAVGSATAYFYVRDTDPWVGDEAEIYITDGPVTAAGIAFKDFVSSMVLPVSGQTVSYTFTAVVKDQNGADMSEAVTWSLKEAVAGVDIDPVSGTVTVSDRAAAGVSFTVVAASGGLSAEKPVAVTKARSAAASVTVSGDDTIGLPASETPVTKTYTAEVKDQYGAVMGGASVIWSIDPAADGVSITGDANGNGVLRVDSNASEGTVTVTAAAAGVAQPGTKTVNVRKDPPVAKAVTITGADSVELPGLTATEANTAVYTATVTDQYGGAMNASTVDWSVPAGLAGVRIAKAANGDGTLFVTKDAAAASVVITAKSGEVTATKTVGITKAESAVTTVTVSGPETVKPGSENNYTAAVKDQYGAAMTGAAVTWSIVEPGAAGVSVDASTGAVTVAGTVAEGTEFTVRAASGDKNGALAVTVSNSAKVTGLKWIVNNPEETGVDADEYVLGAFVRPAGAPASAPEGTYRMNVYRNGERVRSDIYSNSNHDFVNATDCLYYGGGIYTFEIGVYENGELQSTSGRSPGLTVTESGTISNTITAAKVESENEVELTFAPGLQGYFDFVYLNAGQNENDGLGGGSEYYEEAETSETGYFTAEQFSKVAYVSIRRLSDWAIDADGSGTVTISQPNIVAISGGSGGIAPTDLGTVTANPNDEGTWIKIASQGSYPNGVTFKIEGLNPAGLGLGDTYSYVTAEAEGNTITVTIAPINFGNGSFIVFQDNDSEKEFWIHFLNADRNLAYSRIDMDPETFATDGVNIRFLSLWLNDGTKQGVNTEGVTVTYNVGLQADGESWEEVANSETTISDSIFSVSASVFLPSYNAAEVGATLEYDVSYSFTIDNVMYSGFAAFRIEKTE